VFIDVECSSISEKNKKLNKELILHNVNTTMKINSYIHTIAQSQQRGGLFRNIKMIRKGPSIMNIENVLYCSIYPHNILNDGFL
jgi:hypothetical protein